MIVPEGGSEPKEEIVPFHHSEPYGEIVSVASSELEQLNVP